jgi:small-conductance mechanosensitive channel
MKSGLSNGLSAHILPVSATMVGVCMTVVSIVKLVHPSGIGFVIDKLLAADSLIFLASAILSFMSMQRTEAEGAAQLERWAETAFLFALGLVAIAAVLLGFEIV